MPTPNDIEQEARALVARIVDDSATMWLPEDETKAVNDLMELVRKGQREFAERLKSSAASGGEGWDLMPEDIDRELAALNPTESQEPQCTISLCPHCHCMTHDIPSSDAKGNETYCGKCGKLKPSESQETKS